MERQKSSSHIIRKMISVTIMIAAAADALMLLLSFYSFNAFHDDETMVVIMTMMGTFITTKKDT